MEVFGQETVVTLDEKLKEIPTSAGVYLYKDRAGKIIYIGKGYYEFIQWQ